MLPPPIITEFALQYGKRSSTSAQSQQTQQQQYLQQVATLALGDSINPAMQSLSNNIHISGLCIELCLTF
jgi:hypothetical protein